MGNETELGFFFRRKGENQEFLSTCGAAIAFGLVDFRRLCRIQMTQLKWNLPNYISIGRLGSAANKTEREFELVIV